MGNLYELNCRPNDGRIQYELNCRPMVFFSCLFGIYKQSNQQGRKSLAYRRNCSQYKLKIFPHIVPKHELLPKHNLTSLFWIPNISSYNISFFQQGEKTYIMFTMILSMYAKELLGWKTKMHIKCNGGSTNQLTELLPVCQAWCLDIS